MPHAGTILADLLPDPLAHAFPQSDPVILATGHTYDRPSIQRWLDSGHKTCPVTGTRLRHMELTPNFALRSTIAVRRCCWRRWVDEGCSCLAAQ